MTNHRKILALIPFLAIFLVQCAGTRPTGTFDDVDESKLEQSVNKYLGTPYEWGGTSTSGMDCSGFTQRVFQDQEMLIPRTSQQQFGVGHEVAQDNLRPGDLLFYNTTGSGVSHVGIYMDDTQMAHASTNDGVEYADFSTDYWQNKYIGAKRIGGSPYYQGRTSSERIASSAAFPMLVRNLIHVPTTEVLRRRHYSLDFRTNVHGDLVIGSSVAFWNRLEFGLNFTVDQVLGAGKLGLDMPEYRTKFRLWNEGSWYPGIAVGYENIRPRISEIDTAGNVSKSRGKARGLYLASTKNLWDGTGWWVGNTRGYLGLGTTRVPRKTQWSDTYLYVGVQQQLMRNLILMAEWDDIFRENQFNVGMRFALTDLSSIEFNFASLFEEGLQADRQLRFTYYLTY